MNSTNISHRFVKLIKCNRILKEVMKTRRINKSKKLPLALKKIVADYINCCEIYQISNFERNLANKKVMIRRYCVNWNYSHAVSEKQMSTDINKQLNTKHPCNQNQGPMILQNIYDKENI